MSTLLLAPYVRLSSHYLDARQQATHIIKGGWKNEDGIGDGATEKMIYLAAAVLIGTAAVAFAISIFNSAKSNVPTPTPATP